MRPAGLNGPLLLSALFLSSLLSGCGSVKEITVTDPSGSPVKGCYVYAKQENMLYPNTSDLLVTDDLGNVRISRSGLVWIYAGKDGYYITSASLDGERKACVTIYPLNGPVHGQKMDDLVLRKDAIDVMKKRFHAGDDLVRYMTETPVFFVSPGE